MSASMHFPVAKIQSICFRILLPFFVSFRFSFDILTHCNATHSITNRPDDIRLQNSERDGALLLRRTASSLELRLVFYENIENVFAMFVPLDTPPPDALPQGIPGKNAASSLLYFYTNVRFATVTTTTTMCHWHSVERETHMRQALDLDKAPGSSRAHSYMYF